MRHRVGRRELAAARREGERSNPYKEDWQGVARRAGDSDENSEGGEGQDYVTGSPALIPRRDQMVRHGRWSGCGGLDHPWPEAALGDARSLSDSTRRGHRRRLVASAGQGGGGWGCLQVREMDRIAFAGRGPATTAGS